MSATPISTEVVIIGAGPAGLFQVFELGLLGIKAHVLDTLPNAGGQCTELYPDKPIYDIPALPVCGAQELVDRLIQQIKPFGAELHLGEEAVTLHKQPSGRFLVDFNIAYNPYCAYNDHWSCPLTPFENRLKVPIRAGEKIFDGEH